MLPLLMHPGLSCSPPSSYHVGILPLRTEKYCLMRYNFYFICNLQPELHSHSDFLHAFWNKIHSPILHLTIKCFVIKKIANRRKYSRNLSSLSYYPLIYSKMNSNKSFSSKLKGKIIGMTGFSYTLFYLQFFLLQNIWWSNVTLVNVIYSRMREGNQSDHAILAVN